jgi:molybdopterin/thiamine biosynthesis adenylyltransferase
MHPACAILFCVSHKKNKMGITQTFITNLIQRSSTSTKANQQEIHVLSLKKEAIISHQKNISSKQIEIIALENNIVPERYIKNIGTIGIQGQLALLQSRVAVIGLGGLGSFLIELLARMGIGELFLADGDVFAENNLNRQLLMNEKNIGSFKTNIAKKRLKTINSAVLVDIFRGFLDYENAPLLLEGCNAIADGLDNIKDRYMLQSIGKTLNIPYVYGCVAGFFGQVCSIFPGDESISLIYGMDKPSIDYGAELEVGNLPATVAAVAAIQTQEIVKILSNTGQPLRKKLFIIDTEFGETNIIELNVRNES